MSDDRTQTELSGPRILSSGTVISDRYRIEELLGVGGMGMVYRARDTKLGIDVALKILRSDAAAGDGRLERFQRELILARQVSHRNVVRIHDINEFDGLHYITMDFVDGQSLKKLLEGEPGLDVDRALKIAADLADALDEAHRVDIVHRDIKPGNVLVVDSRAYLTDFGIARSLTADGLTKTGTIIGTLDYLSPEQVRGHEVDGRADIYAVGLLLYEMLTGARPFTGETAEEVLAQRALGTPPDISTTGIEVPAGVREIVSRCLQVAPDDRYQSAAELARDLRQGHAAHPVRKLRRKYIVGAVAVAAIVLTVWTVRSGLVETGGGAVPAAGRSIAALPFNVATDDANPQSLATGLGELLSENLAASPDLRIVDSRRVYATLRDLRIDAYEFDENDLSLLGDLLDADYLVSGRLQQLGASYRVEADLRLGTSGESLHKTTRDVADAVDVFNATAALAPELLDAIDAESAHSGSILLAADPEALRAYAEGLQHLSGGNALAALAPLQRAVELAPGFAVAWDRLGQALARLGRDAEALIAADNAVRGLSNATGRTAATVRARRAALTGDFDTARSELEQLLAQFPQDAETQFMLAEINGESGELRAAEELLRSVVATSPDHPQAWYLLGKYAILQGNAERAASDYLVRALVIQNRLHNLQGKADVTNALGIAQAQLGNLEQAATYYREAIELRERIGDERGVATALANLASIQIELGEYDAALEGLLAARARLADIGDQWTVANLANELGYLEEQRGRFDAALTHYREALRLRRDLGDQRALAESHNNVGFAYYLHGDYDNASVHNEQALVIYEATDNADGLMLAYQTRGILQLARGRYDASLKALLESLRIGRELGNDIAVAVANGYIGRVQHLQARYDSSAASYDEALRLFRDAGDTRGLAEFTLRKAQLLLDLGMWDAAGDSIVEARRLLADDSGRARRALLFRIDAEWQSARGNDAEAAALLDNALAQATASGERLAVLEARLAIARIKSGSVDTLREIRDAAVDLGHRPLQLQAGIALGAALVEDGQHDAAVKILRESLATDAAGTQFNGDYLAHFLIAQAMSGMANSEAAEDHWHRAGEAVTRTLARLDPRKKKAFAGLSEVRSIVEQTGIEYDRG